MTTLLYFHWDWDWDWNWNWDWDWEWFIILFPLIVAMIDATANELPHTRVRSFPTIKLYKKGDNQAAEYNGEREFTS